MAASLCAPRPGLSLIARQHLFSLYVHAASNFTGVSGLAEISPCRLQSKPCPLWLGKFLFSN